MNLASWIVLGIVAVLFFLALKHTLKHGTCDCGSCGGGCSGNCASCKIHLKDIPKKKNP